MSTAAQESLGGSQVRTLSIASICRDGGTQHRTIINSGLVGEYSAQMREGTVFPPVRIWWDGECFWLSDGFHRVAAAEAAGFGTISAEVHFGSPSDAQWDSFSANSSHGARWTSAENLKVIQLALGHPNAAQLSNVELAKHLHVSEKTIRRWRKKVSSAHAEDTVRLVTRGQSTYSLTTKKIGRHRADRSLKSRKRLRAELALMKQKGSPKARRLLIILGNWALGSAAPVESLEAIEQVLTG